MASSRDSWSVSWSVKGSVLLSAVMIVSPNVWLKFLLDGLFRLLGDA